MSRKHENLLRAIFQDPVSSLDPRMTVREIVAEGLAAQGIGRRRERDDRVRDILHQVGLRPEAASRYPHRHPDML